MINKISLAIKRVPETSYRINNRQFSSDGSHTGYQSPFAYPERNFICRVMVELVQIVDLNQMNLSADVDLTKDVQNSGGDFHNIFFEETKRRLTRNNKFQPDLVIHRGQEYCEPIHQILALECKINPKLQYKDFCYDLFKLMIYKELLHFQTLCYLIINKKPSKIEALYTSYKDEFYINESNLHILVKENYDSEIKCIVHNEEDFNN